MSTPTYTLINQITLAAASSVVTFSSIPQSFRDLIIVINGSAAANTELKLRYNGDAGNNYFYVAVDNTYNEAGTANSAGNFLYLNTNRWQHSLQVFDYSSVDKHKTTLLRRNSPQQPSVSMECNRWANQSAITSASLTAQSSQMSTGMVISLYGIVG